MNKAIISHHFTKLFTVSHKVTVKGNIRIQNFIFSIQEKPDQKIHFFHKLNYL